MSDIDSPRARVEVLVGDREHLPLAAVACSTVTCREQRRAENEMDPDPVATNPDLYKIIYENDRVRVLEYLDEPGDRTEPHAHPDSVMFTLSSFRRRLYAGGGTRDVDIAAETVAWLPAQEHAGHNIGDTPTRAIFVELKERAPEQHEAPVIGPAGI